MAITAAGFSNGGTASTTAAAPAPATVATGDLLLIWVISQAASLTFSSTGWTAVTASTGQNCSVQLLWKTATSTDVTLAAGSGSYTVTCSVSHSIAGIIVDAPGASFDPSTPTSSGQLIAAAATSFPVTGSTTTSNGDLLLWFGGIRNTTGTTAAIGIPAGFTTAVAQVSTTVSGATVGALLASKTQTTAGATGSTTGTFAATEDGGGLLVALTQTTASSAPAGLATGTGTAQLPTVSAPVTVSAGLASGTGTAQSPAAGLILSLRSAATATTGAGSSTLAVPAQPVAIGDLIFISASVGFASLTFTADPADSFTAETANSPATALSTQLFRKIADSGDVAKAGGGGTYTITVSTSHPWSACIGVVPVSSTAHPFDPSDTPGSGQTNAASVSVTAASITTGTSGDLLVWIGTSRNTGGVAPPAITVPSGYTVPPGVSQANSSGSATPNVGVVLATATQASAGATGSQAGSIGSSQITAGLLLAIKAVPSTPLPGTSSQLVAGAPTSSSIQVVANTSGATSCRLAYSVSSNMSSPSFVSAQTPDALGYVRYTVTGLTAHTRYYVQLADTPSGGSETMIGLIGACKTLPAAGSAQNFTVALVSCIAESDVTSPAQDTAITDWISYDADLNIYTGDFDYSGTTSTVTSTQVGVYQSQISSIPHLSSMVSTRWGFYCRSDHEAGPDNGDSDNTYTATNIAAAQEVFPMGTLGDTVNTPVHGLYQTWVVGRVRFIMIDIRNIDRSPGSNTDNGSKTMLGATQLAWFESQLIQPEPLKVIVSDVAWMGTASITNGPDKWWSYDTERQAILSYIAANRAQVGAVMLWHGDSHLVGCTPGLNNAYGGFPVYCAAPLLNIGGGLNTGTFTHFYNNGGSGECRQYGRISFTDDGTTITSAFQGWDATNAIAQVNQTDVFVTVAAGLATGAGAAQSPAAAAGVSAGLAAGTGAARGPALTTAASVTAGLATGTSAAQSPALTTTASVTAVLATAAGAAQGAFAGIGARAGAATGTGTAQSPALTTAASVTAGTATGTGTAQSPALTTAASVTAVLATGTGTAQSPALTTTASVTAVLATGTGTAQGAFAAIGARASAAAGTGTAQAPSLAITVTASVAAGTAAAQNATVSTSASGSASAGLATGTGAAQSPALTTTAQITAGAATGTGAARGPALTAVASVPAGLATAAGTAQGTAAAIAISASAATGTGAAQGPAIAVSVTAVLAAGTGTAQSATVSTVASGSANAGVATGTGTAQAPSLAIAVTATAATGTAAAQNATASTVAATTANAGLATGTGAATALAALTAASVLAGVATGLGVAQNAAAMSAAFTNAQAVLATGTGAARNATGQNGWSAFAGPATGAGFALAPSLVHGAIITPAILALIATLPQVTVGALMQGNALASVTRPNPAATAVTKTATATSGVS